MKCSLDTTKASKLRGVINKNDYCYMYDYDRYFELCTIMDRMEDTVELINNFELPEKEDQFNATDFISWLNYAHLIYNCLFSLNKIFVVPNNKTLFACGKTKFYNDIEKHKTKYLGKYYSGVADGSDDDFFRYLRSMVLAHALKIDHEEFEKFSGSKYTYTPLVRWNSAKDSVDISYYVPDYKDKHRHLSIDISDLFEYLKTRYDYLDIIFDFIDKSKKSERKTKQSEYREAFSNIPSDLSSKYDLLWNKYKELGNIDVKNNADLLSCYLLQSKELIDYEFKTNLEQISIFYEVLNAILDIEIKALVSQKSNNLVISNFYNGNSLTKNGGVFSAYSYEIEKITSDYESLLCFGGNDFDDKFEKVKDLVVKYVAIDAVIERREKAYLCVISYCFDNVLYDKKLSKQLPQDLVEKLEKKYEIQI